jgi:hypothetical protein
MSVAVCETCGRYIDTDCDVEGEFSIDPPFDYTCVNCLEKPEEEEDDYD